MIKNVKYFEYLPKLHIKYFYFCKVYKLSQICTTDCIQRKWTKKKV